MMNTMNTNLMFDCDQYLPIGGNMLGDLSMCWPDDLSIKAEPVGLPPTNVYNKSAPGEDFSSNFETDATMLETWNSEGMNFENLDMSIFEGLLQADPASFFDGPKEMSKDQNPGSPFSSDSGIGSPGSSDSPICSPSSPYSVVNSPETFTSEDLGTIHLDLSEIEGLPPVSSNDVAFLESLCETTTTAPTVEPNTTTISIAALSFLPTSLEVISKPHPIAPKKATKPTKCKSLTSTEKKERKREQNKNAATRYREKKRTEGDKIMKEQLGLEDKNKELKDKTAQITREIQYLKELLTEVYRTKGIIE